MAFILGLGLLAATLDIEELLWSDSTTLPPVSRPPSAPDLGTPADIQTQPVHDTIRPTRFQMRYKGPDTSVADAIPDSTPFERRFPNLWRDFHPPAAKFPKEFKPLSPKDVGLKPTPLNGSLPYIVSDEEYAVNLLPQLIRSRHHPYVCLARPVSNCLRALLYHGASHPSIADVCEGYEYTTGAHFKTFKDLPSASKNGTLSAYWDDYICAKNKNDIDTFCSYNPATLMIEPPARNSTLLQDVLNVVSLQLDAISRTRFRATYPETAKYLENMNDPTSAEAKGGFSKSFDFP
jgi:hypothetical protein